MSADRVVVVGAGIAALRAVEAMRRDGHEGEILLVGGEEHLPYDRPPLSKQVLTGEVVAEETELRSLDHYSDIGVELLLGERATHLSAADRTLTVGDRAIPFDRAVIATGAVPRQIPNPERLEGVHTLRTLDDARRLRTALVGAPEVVVIGAGPIGAEVASSARAGGAGVTVIEALPAPFSRALGQEMGAVCGSLHGDHGTRLLCGAVVEALEGHERVEQIRLRDGRLIRADVVVAGIGVEPDLRWLERSGLLLGDGVVCDASLQTSTPGIYAIGDVACWPNPRLGVRMRAEQWTAAVEQGRHVGRQIASAGQSPAPYASDNYFWSDQYGVRIQFAGSADADHVEVVAGDVEERSFLGLYRRGDTAVGAVAMDMPGAFMKCKRLLERAPSWSEALDLVSPTVEAS